MPSFYNRRRLALTGAVLVVVSALMGARIDRAMSRQARLESIQGTVPSLLNPPPGCRFAARCKYAMDICTKEIPPLKDVAPGHRVACVL